MQNIRKNDLGVDKENIQSLQNYRNFKQVPKRAFGKNLPTQNNIQQTNNSQVTDKLKKPDAQDKPLENFNIVNPQLVEPFQAHILEYLKSRLSLYFIDASYMSKQNDINSRMRAILIDWLVDVNLKFKLLPQSLFITVNIIDRYLSLRTISRSELQLLGIAALMITGKYEEIYPPVLKDYTAVCDNAYNRADILRMEADVIKTLEFNLTQPSSIYFLQLVQQKLKLEPRPLIFVQYILEIALLDTESLKFDNLTLVAGAVYLVNKIFKRGKWNNDYSLICGVSEHNAKVCAKELYLIMHQVDSLGLSAIKKKFSTPVYFEVSRFKVEKVNGSRH